MKKESQIYSAQECLSTILERLSLLFPRVRAVPVWIRAQYTPCPVYSARGKLSGDSPVIRLYILAHAFFVGCTTIPLPAMRGRSIVPGLQQKSRSYSKWRDDG